MITWRKSSYSQGAGVECVEVARVQPGVAVRDSKDPSGPVLTFRRRELRVFFGAIKAGTLDLR